MTECCSDVKASKEVVNTEDSMWTIDANSGSDVYADNALVISLAKPATTEEERKWKRGERHCLCLTLPAACTCNVYQKFKEQACYSS